MKIYFDDSEYDGQFLRSVDYAPLGAQIGEAWAIAGQVQVGDTTSWYNAWSSYADRLYELAVKSRDAGHRVSARSAFLRASNYYRTAYIFMFALPVNLSTEQHGGEFASIICDRDFESGNERPAFPETDIPACIETRSAPAVARCYPCSFTFYLGNLFPRFLSS